VTAANNTKASLAGAGGYTSTIATSGQGASGNVPVTNKSLLGQ